MANRATVTLEAFIKVTVVNRATITTAKEAASALGMTPESFKQKLKTNRERYPDVFKAVPVYETVAGPRVASTDEAANVLAYLIKARDEAAEKEVDTASEDKAEAPAE